MFQGFVDLQVNGRAGISFADKKLTREEIDKVSQGLRERGVVGYCPTVVTESPETYEHVLPLLARAAAEDTEGAKILGIHVEGPFINPKDGPRGAHPLQHVAPPTVERFEQLRKWADDRIAILTLAPEVDGALHLIEYVSNKTQTLCSIGHCEADAEQIRRAVDAGARLHTHTGNGIADMQHRHFNPMYTVLVEDRLNAMFITDSHHLPADLVRLCLRAKGVERFIVTSDMVSIAGLAPGEYEFHGLIAVLEPDGYLHQKGKYALAGSANDMLDCMNFLASLGELDEAGLRAVGHDNPLRVLGADIEPARLAQAPGIEFDGKVFSIK